ncbi:PgaD family protein [Carboxydothermus ferrireducens]|uniref:Poly-beta-1,6-N-acetyl-D-glucosamine biosynthesis protein PgaD n=1 Tax=Carboxydothermus ferrireducens DSM 11255 TaxID=1119529 RepID=A0ABX2R9B0_9THEO|nr:PgaD family protein [Carboxydothermus ferrireducens]NYE56726.1 poly-beta-1,6-N-acetyl-D-glucosamine biosynthesis protein PgaD [Carboxydothermus ferrireducens DSM 11255]
MKKDKFLKIKNSLRFMRNLILTFAAWTVILYLINNVIIAIGWFLISLLWKKELLIPQSMRYTVYTIFKIQIYAIAVFLTMILWAKYNYKNYFSKNKRKLESLNPDNSVTNLSWKEAVFDVNAQKIKEIIH